MKRYYVLATLILVLAFTTCRKKAIPQPTSYNKSSFEFLELAYTKDSSKKSWIYLPKGYADSEESYPVLYLTDGQNLFADSTSYAGEWYIDEYLDSLSAKVIVVGIEHGGVKRNYELTPTVHPEYKGGEGEIFLNFITDKLKPAIDKKYRTLAEAENTTIGGASLGGLFALYALIEGQTSFGNAIAYSPSLWWDEAIFTWAEDHDFKKQKIYLATGSKESDQMIPPTNKMIELLKQKGLKDNQLKGFIAEGYKHSETFWRTDFPQAFQFIYGD